MWKVTGFRLSGARGGWPGGGRRVCVQFRKAGQATRQRQEEAPTMPHLTPADRPQRDADPRQGEPPRDGQPPAILRLVPGEPVLHLHRLDHRTADGRHEEHIDLLRHLLRGGLRERAGRGDTTRCGRPTPRATPGAWQGAEGYLCTSPPE